MSKQLFQANWNYPTQMRFGAGRIKELPEVCQSLNIKKPLLVTDPGLAELSMTQYVVQNNIQKKIATTVFCDIKSNPTGENVAQGVKAYHEGQHDGVIAMGGGSALDTGKTIAFMVGQTRSIWDFEDVGDNYLRASEAGIAKIIAIPTTAGTGSEAGRAAVIVDLEAHSKKLIFHPKLMPSVVISDPELTLSLPENLTAATGMDALAHNMEAYFSPGFHPMADGIALEGMRLIKENLITAVTEGKNLEARTMMLAAATMGAAAFQKGLGVIHSLSHPVGALYDAHHGLLNAIFMPYALTFNRDYIEDKCVALASHLQLPNPGFQAIYDWVIDLCHSINIPLSLQAIGVDASRADEVATLAMQDPSTPGNPRPLTHADMKAIFINAVHGKI